MAFKMRGFSAFTKKTDPPNGKLLKSENPDTKITGGSKQEKIADLEDRIEFIKEDIFNQDGEATNQQKSDIAKLEAKLRAIKK